MNTIILDKGPTALFIHDTNGNPLIIFHSDGRIEVTENANPTETAQKVIEAMRPLFYTLIQKAHNIAIAAAAQKAEDFGHSNGRIRASHKHIAIAIRNLRR